MIRGFDAVIDCAGTGGAFQINGVGQAVISGFDVRNAVGSTTNNGFAGGVDAINTRNISVLSSTFRNCTGKEAGAIAVHTDTRSVLCKTRSVTQRIVGSLYVQAYRHFWKRYGGREQDLPETCETRF